MRYEGIQSNFAFKDFTPENLKKEAEALISVSLDLWNYRHIVLYSDFESAEKTPDEAQRHKRHFSIILKPDFFPGCQESV